MEPYINNEMNNSSINNNNTTTTATSETNTANTANSTNSSGSYSSYVVNCYHDSPKIVNSPMPQTSSSIASPLPSNYTTAKRNSISNLGDISLPNKSNNSNSNNLSNEDNLSSTSTPECNSNNINSQSNTTTTTTTTTSTNNKKEEQEQEIELKDDVKEEKKEEEVVEEFVIINNEFYHTGLVMYDNYGFLVDQDQIQLHIIYKDKFQKEDIIRKNHWIAFLEKNPSALQLLGHPGSPMSNNTVKPGDIGEPSNKTYRQNIPKNFKDLMRKGIPSEYRSVIWLRSSGALARLSENPDEYYNILEKYKGKKSIATKQIQMDVDRTFPDHKFLNTKEKMESLTNVLVAYSWRNPKVGYCQCMNFIAGFLLIYMSEHEAYWTLCAIIEELLPTEYFTSTMIDSSVDVRFVFEDLMQRKLPRLYTHLTSLNLTLPLIITQWFLCIMATTTPTETTFRIWDVFFSEGSKVLFRVALSFFKINEEKILSCKDYVTVYNLIKKIPSGMYDADLLLDVCFNGLGSFPMKNILQKRKDSKVVVTSEYLEFQRRKQGLDKE
ncbi:hypothetical protein CYY_003773 [Polysphondylium violaceum]|uniref:Rab-GAP TBC domain-containing protein n=1 Tax=Polysphondylium violaceum TaxID=133409 RepID=A0A8J4UZZ3_9MYCE|nr:hypothetical protein CYY_003773 [Polysphondylium violaceum]